MRVTSSMYYKNLYGNNNTKLTNKLFDVNKQIASGLQIQYAKDDVRTFTETMRLDNEITTLEQITKSTESGYKVSNQTDETLNEFTDSLNRMRVLLIQASNGTNDEASLGAIAKELRGIESNLKSTANTSINGQYLFSGSSVNVKPISEDGTYNGNDIDMKSFVGSHNQQKYNVTGAELFLGEESLVKREITTNKENNNLLLKYDNLKSTSSDNEPLSRSSTIRNLMGDTDSNVDSVNEKHFFYIRGTKSDGVSIKEKISFKDDDSVGYLLDQIGTLYGNTPTANLVDVTLNSSGNIVISDRQNGSSKLDFHMVGAVDYTGGNDADVTNIDDLDDGESDFDKIIANTSTATKPKLFIKEFITSDYIHSSEAGVASNIDGILYDRTQFNREKGSTLLSNTSQVLKQFNMSGDPYIKLDENSFAQPSTKLSDVFSGVEVIPATNPKTYTLDGTTLKLVGKDIAGNNYSVTVDLKSSGSTFSPDGGATNYDIFNMETPRVAVDADKMTYQQLMDVVNMTVTNELPSANTTDEYDNAIIKSNYKGQTSLSYDGKLQFGDLTAGNTKASLSLYDANTNDFSKNASVATFNSNNTLTVRDPKTDFFKEIDEIIKSVEEYKLYPKTDNGDKRTIGMENSLGRLDDLADHIFKTQSTAGAQSNTLSDALDRTEILRVSTIGLRSDIIDTDLAEASLQLTQLNLNYEAMLSTVGKVSKLSLVNYL